MTEANPNELRMLVTRTPSDATAGKLPPQPHWPAPPVDWNDYDVPRIWDSLGCLDHEVTWDQARTIARQGDLLNAQAEALERLRDRLAEAWSGGQTPAAAAALGKIDWLIKAIRADALAAATTARGVNGVLETMASAKRAMEPVANRWLGVTRTDPRAWRPLADELNEKARKIMVSADAVIRDHRENIIVPAQTRPPTVAVVVPPPDPRKPVAGGSRFNGDASTDWTPGAKSGVHAPSGAEPVETEIPAEPGPVLSGLPVPGISGGVPSALPIFPGSEYARGGGAYVMPGGAGTPGQVVPMPARPAAVPQGSGPGGSVGMMPMPTPMGGATPGSGGGSGDRYRQGAHTRWEVQQGGPAVIEPGPQLGPRPAESELDPDDFREWFT
ncbi:hypothetical protein ACFQY4_01415 [Catellatospora bangladeshensis]|uniref:PPE family domain-containing protein n=1 Tax=Catellatospora bangladeshensis TaxID=310355 RepID=A0A8J3NJE3_9ACTN|nr:hypothetical protein [Catellatospora bangladeshensis]GIF81371.1 hypothetical protein Cba03nite_27200 [Catellatospora bangladeshensis]